MEANFWKHRYEEGSTGWDLGDVSPPLKSYIDQLVNKELNILIPGAGRAYEAEYLHKKGFKNVYVADLVESAFADFIKRCPSFPVEHCIIGDFFEIEQVFDLLLEQTFFCALHPTQRKAYADKSAALLHRGASIVGVMFQFPLTEIGPPFGGSKMEYLSYFSRMFAIDKLEDCYNSHSTREGKELFIKFTKK